MYYEAPQKCQIIEATHVNAAFGKVLQEARTKCGLTQNALADRSGVSRVTIANIESGRQNVGLHQLFLLARSLDQPVEKLLPHPFQVEAVAHTPSEGSACIVVPWSPESARALLKSQDVRFSHDDEAVQFPAD